jgi:hypothetical protein
METVSFQPQNVKLARLKGKALFYLPIFRNGEEDILHYAYLFGGDSSVISPLDCRIQPIAQSIGRNLKRCQDRPLILTGTFKNEEHANSFFVDRYRGYPGFHEKEKNLFDILYGEFCGYMETYDQQGLNDITLLTPKEFDVLCAINSPTLLPDESNIISFTLENLIALFDKSAVRGLPVISIYTIMAYFNPTEQKPNKTIEPVVKGLIKKNILGEVFTPPNQFGHIHCYYELNRPLIESIHRNK